MGTGAAVNPQLRPLAKQESQLVNSGSNLHQHPVPFTDLQGRMAIASLLPYKSHAYFSCGQP